MNQELEDYISSEAIKHGPDVCLEYSNDLFALCLFVEKMVRQALAYPQVADLYAETPRYDIERMTRALAEPEINMPSNIPISEVIEWLDNEARKLNDN